jgi:hypothetical protein
VKEILCDGLSQKDKMFSHIELYKLRTERSFFYFIIFYKLYKSQKYHKRWNTDEKVYIIVDNNII